MNQKTVHTIGWIASFMGVLVYFSYIDQIRLNLAGQPGSVLLPVFTTINATIWTLYGTLKEIKDWPIIVCNIPGIILGFLTAVTGVYSFS